MTDPLLLSIDCGTQSLRAMLFSPEGRLLARAQESYAPYVSPRAGWAEQDPDIYWQGLVKACRRLRQDHPSLFARIAGVGITTQRASMINVDIDGTPLRPAILWLDQRQIPLGTGLPAWFKLGIKPTFLSRKLLTIHSQGKCSWIRINQPGIWEKTHKYLQVSGFLNYCLTGEFSDSVAAQIGHLPFDYKKQQWASALHICRVLFPVEPEKLPRLVTPGTVLGKVTSKASSLTGIEAGCPVISCGSDKGCETLGAGVTQPDMVSLSFGTTATVQTTTRRYFEPIDRMPPYPSPVPGSYNPEVEIFRGFWMITWFKNQFAWKEKEEAKARGVSVEKLLNRCLEKTGPGAMGLLVQPYWGPGLDLPHAKGAMIGFGDVHTRDHIYRAMIEGLGFALYEGMEKIRAKSGVQVSSAAVSGGASQSEAICRIAADIFNLPMIKGRTHETSGLGAAILTASGAGLYPSIPAAAKEMVKVDRVFEPTPDHVDIYKELYSRVYRHIYRSLKPLYVQIQQITGYPSI